MWEVSNGALKRLRLRKKPSVTNFSSCRSSSLGRENKRVPKPLFPTRNRLYVYVSQTPSHTQQCPYCKAVFSSWFSMYVVVVVGQFFATRQAGVAAAAARGRVRRQHDHHWQRGTERFWLSLEKDEKKRKRTRKIMIHLSRSARQTQAKFWRKKQVNREYSRKCECQESTFLHPIQIPMLITNLKLFLWLKRGLIR